jgi:hypothetical protein
MDSGIPDSRTGRDRPSRAGRPATRRERVAETRARLGTDGLRAATVIWLVVNAVNLLQAAGFATRPFAPEINPALGLVIAVLALPATRALQVLARVRAGGLWYAGPLAFDAFVILMLVVDHLARFEWRHPLVPAVAVPYLGLFFGSILLMGLPMIRIDPRRWLLTVVTTVALLGAMLYAMSQGVG